MTIKSIIEDFLYDVLFVVFVFMLVLTELYWTIRPSKRIEYWSYEWWVIGPTGLTNEPDALEEKIDFPTPILCER